MVFTKGHPFGKRFKKGQIPWNKTTGIIKKCLKCGKTFRVPLSRNKVNHCYYSCSRKGKPTWNKGLTKQTNPIVAKYGKSGSIAKKGKPLPQLKEYQFKKGLIPWNWKGDNASYSSIHKWLVRHKGKAKNYKCIDCNKTADHWSNVDGKYKRDTKDFQPRCASCHRIYDNNKGGDN